MVSDTTRTLTIIKVLYMSNLHDGALLKQVYNQVVKKMDLSPGRINTFMERYIRNTRPPSTSRAAINVDAGNMTKALKQEEITWRTLLRFIRSLPARSITIRIIVKFDDASKDLDIPIDVLMHKDKKLLLYPEEKQNDRRNRD